MALFIVKHKTEEKRLTRKLTALRQHDWRLMHTLVATRRWVLRGRAARALRLLWLAAQLSSAPVHRDLAALSRTTEPDKQAHGLAGVRHPGHASARQLHALPAPGRRRDVERLFSEEPSTGNPPAQRAKLLDH